ncbi:hypothetical protein [Methylobacterium nodulans]|uniref:hypothetical protein n=1 Tax=Methylobacterium nodulans TaxID=114616 RepID=UPI001FCC5FFD|nr:hypothetical protein [Methylobacterium nodulans]
MLEECSGRFWSILDETQSNAFNCNHVPTTRLGVTEGHPISDLQAQQRDAKWAARRDLVVGAYQVTRMHEHVSPQAWLVIDPVDHTTIG